MSLPMMMIFPLFRLAVRLSFTLHDGLGNDNGWNYCHHVGPAQSQGLSQAPSLFRRHGVVFNSRLDNQITLPEIMCKRES